MPRATMTYGDGQRVSIWNDSILAEGKVFPFIFLRLEIVY